LGLNYSFNTTVFTNGEIDDQTLNGDLFISLSGDPSLESRFFAKNLKILRKIVFVIFCINFIKLYH